MDKWDSRFMEMAHVIAGWTSCYRPGRSIGCVIVKDKRIMTTGYNGAPAGLKTCRERGECMRDRLGIQSGTRAELCYAIHAEQNAIIQAATLGQSIEGGETWRFHRRRDALLHAPAVQRLRKDDYQCRHPPCRVSGRLPGLLLAGYF